MRGRFTRGGLIRWAEERWADKRWVYERWAEKFYALDSMASTRRCERVKKAMIFVHTFCPVMIGCYSGIYIREKWACRSIDTPFVYIPYYLSDALMILN